jgi:pyruvate dehydrogenase E2 component (dihydrolipoamide acetyltransferase)
VPEWRDDQWVPKQVVSGTLSVDHRVADGAHGAELLERIAEIAARPLT